MQWLQPAGGSGGFDISLIRCRLALALFNSFTGIRFMHMRELWQLEIQCHIKWLLDRLNMWIVDFVGYPEFTGKQRPNHQYLMSVVIIPLLNSQKIPAHRVALEGTCCINQECKTLMMCSFFCTVPHEGTLFGLLFLECTLPWSTKTFCLALHYHGDHGIPVHNLFVFPFTI